MENKELNRICPACHNTIYYYSKRRLNQSIKEGKHCKSCSKKGNNNPNFGIKQSNETCLKKSNFQKQRYSDPKEKLKMSILAKNSWKNPEIRKKLIDNAKYINRKVDKGQLELIKKWNHLGFNFNPNYIVRTEHELFFVDGYDKEKNIVFEYDSKYHNRISQKQKDLVRQNKIIEILKPKKFWRYNSVNKKFTEIIGENKL